MTSALKPKIDPAYLHVADPFPLQMPDSGAGAEVYTALADGRLITTECAACAAVHFPPRVSFCPACGSGSPSRWVELPREGRVIGFSIQETGLPPGFKPPVVFAVVEVGSVRLFTIIGGDPADTEIGSIVHLDPMRIADNPDGSPRYLPAFKSSK
jgi:uncharacterized OB-fold protein